jgi:glucosyl-3-phosphoglycerate synthase
VLEELSYVQGWGVEIALLIDIANRYGADAIAQVDLGIREHRHRGLHALSVQAAEVMATMLGRVPNGSLLADSEHRLRRADGSEVPLNLAERPPLAWLTR